MHQKSKKHRKKKSQNKSPFNIVFFWFLAFILAPKLGIDGEGFFEAFFKDVTKSSPLIQLAPKSEIWYLLPGYWFPSSPPSLLSFFLTLPFYLCFNFSFLFPFCGCVFSSAFVGFNFGANFNRFVFHSFS